MSAAAPAIGVETSVYFQAPSSNSNEALQNLAHELRQPLSSIEAIAYYVEMTLPPELLQARQYMYRLQELVAQTESILRDATPTIRKPPASAGTAAS